LVPSDKKWLDTLKPIAEIGERDFNNWPAVQPNAWGIIPLSLWKYLNGDYSAAKQWCRRALASPDKSSARDASIHMILAMSFFRLGRQEEARVELDQGRMMIENQFLNGLPHDVQDQDALFWWDWVYARILMREAATLIGESPAASPRNDLPDSSREGRRGFHTAMATDCVGLRVIWS
jgi:hypothetical protein